MVATTYKATKYVGFASINREQLDSMNDVGLVWDFLQRLFSIVTLLFDQF